MRDKKGLSLLPIIVAIIISFIVIIVMVSVSLQKSEEEKKDHHRVATELSDLGMQEFFVNLGNPNDIDTSALHSFDKDDNNSKGKIKVIVDKKMDNSKMLITITSKGICCDQTVSQKKRLTLIKTVGDSSVIWSVANKK